MSEQDEELARVLAEIEAASEESDCEAFLSSRERLILYEWPRICAALEEQALEFWARTGAEAERAREERASLLANLVRLDSEKARLEAALREIVEYTAADKISIYAEAKDPNMFQRNMVWIHMTALRALQIMRGRKEG